MNIFKIVKNRIKEQPEAVENRENEPLRIEEVPKTTPRAIKPRKSSKMAPKILPAVKASEESFKDLNADGDFEACDSNSASSIDDEETASVDGSEGNKMNNLLSIFEKDGKQCVKINNKTYSLTELKLENDES